MLSETSRKEFLPTKKFYPQNKLYRNANFETEILLFNFNVFSINPKLNSI